MKIPILQSLKSIFSFSTGKNDDPVTVLKNEIQKAGFPKKEVAIAFETFFEGNSIVGSIAPNVEPEMKTEVFYEELKKLNSDPKTTEILVRIADMDDEEWPYSDAIYVIGDWTVQELKKKIKKLQPDEVMEGWMYDKPTNRSAAADKVITLWWD